MTEPEAESWRRRAKVLSRKSADDRDPDERDPDERKSVSPSQAEETSQPVPTDPEPEQPAPDQWQALDALTAFEAAMEESGEAGLRRQKRFSWVEWSGLVAVAGLLIAAMVMWYQRPTGLAPTTKVDDAVNMPPDRQRPAEPSGQSKRDPTAASAKDRSMPDSGNRQRAVQIADRVLDDAGDGSFALENSGENGIEMNIANSPADAKPPSDSELNSSTESTANPGPKKKPRVYARAPDPKSIQPLARPVIACEAEQPLRKQLELLPRTRAFISFDRIYPIAFEAHQNYLAIKSADSDSEEIESELVKCIGLFEQCLDRPANEFTDEQHQQIAYTLAKLYFDAGHLYESAVYAMAVARSADSTQPIANSAVTLAFAALQEAHLAHYGAPSLPGELRQMERLCDLVSSRGLKHPQLDAMRFATAQRFDQAGMHVKAAQIFTQIAKSSPLFAKAQLAAGRSFWSEAMIRERDGIKSQLEAIVSSAAKYLGIAIDEANDDESATPSFLAGQFALAEIALRRDDPDTAIELLEGPKGLLQRAVGGPSGSPQVSKDFLTAAYERLFQAYSKVGDLEGIQGTLETLSKRYGKKGKERIAQLQTQVAREFLESLGENRPITADQVGQLESVMKTVLDPNRKPSVDVILWAAESWAKLASRSNQVDVRKRCFDQADRLLEKASEAGELDAQQKMSLQLQRADLATIVGENDHALSLLTEILKQSPSAVDLQIKVAHLLLDQAKASPQRELFETAISGRPDGSIWGWAVLTNNLARMHLDSDDKSRYLDRLLESGYYLNESRILQAEAMPPGDQRDQLLDVARKHIRQLVATFGQSSKQWTEKLQSLQP